MAENENAAAPASEPTGQEGEAATTTAAAESPRPDAPQPEAAQPEAPQPEAPPEEITYHAVEKDGQVTALWEMQGRKHLRTIDPRSRQGQEILRLYTSEHGE
ncbi:MAG: hypothetical protein QOJ76_128 [Acidobacteriota bacterium]|jgi:hypothetical protein|nr:hypothetical protein [Acidobacteriota bacterium]